MKETFVTANIPLNGKNQKVTFHRSKGIGLPLPGIAQGNEQQVNALLVKVLPYEEALLKWLGASTKNAALFVEDPFTAIVNANIGIPQDILDELKKTSNDLLTNLKK